MIKDQYLKNLQEHYSSIWEGWGNAKTWGKGNPLPQQCDIIEFAPVQGRPFWIYATCGMTVSVKSDLLELFLLSPFQSEGHVELLTAIAHYHQTNQSLGLGDTVNFGRSWSDGSKCDHGLISLPYPFGPKLENAFVSGEALRVLWLVPITPEERAFIQVSGLDALEEVFEKNQFNCLDIARPSMV